MRVVADTNILVSAFLWGGTPGKLIAAAGRREVRLFTSRELLDELFDVLHRKPLAADVRATALEPAQLVAYYRRLARTVKAVALDKAVSPDPDDDAVLACARAARADLVVTGDRKHLLALGEFSGIPIVDAAEALVRIAANRRRKTHALRRGGD